MASTPVRRPASAAATSRHRKPVGIEPIPAKSLDYFVQITRNERNDPHSAEREMIEERARNRPADQRVDSTFSQAHPNLLHRTPGRQGFLPTMSGIGSRFEQDKGFGGIENRCDAIVPTGESDHDAPSFPESDKSKADANRVAQRIIRSNVLI